jgi:hypothetical protein
MSLKLKALGLALFAALAVGAVSVVSAGADSGGVMHSDVDWTHLTGKQEGPTETEMLHENVLHDFDLDNAVTCEVANYTATLAEKTATEVTVIPEYDKCKTTTGGYPVEIDMTGCNFRLTFTDVAAEKHHTAHLVCPPEKNVDITVDPPLVGVCHITIPPQTPTSGGIAYTTHQYAGSEKHGVTLDITAEGITNSKVSTGFGCGSAPTHSNNSALTGTVTVEGKDTENKQVNVTVTTAAS